MVNKKDISVCRVCWKFISKDSVHTCTPVYNYQSFVKYFEAKKSIADNPETIPDIKYWSWTRRIDFLWLFVQVFWDVKASYIEVNYNLGFVIINQEAYIDREFLTFCKKHNITDNKALKLYMDFTDNVANKDTNWDKKEFLEFFKKNKKDYI